MDERIRCEFFVLRYVPDTVKGEFVNIGVVLRDAERMGRTEVRFTRDWSRVRCLDADADLPMLESLEADLKSRISLEVPDVRPLMEVLESSFSNSVQLSSKRACLAESLPAEMETLLRMYVEPNNTGRQRGRQPRSGRGLLEQSMRREFERAGVWELLQRRIPASRYTRPGDPLRIDCGYRPNGVVKMFHSVSLVGDLELAKVLAYSAGDLRAGVARVEGASLELTAVVERVGNVSEEAAEGYRFGVQAMEAAEIRVMTTGDLARIADRARQELRP